MKFKGDKIGQDQVVNNLHEKLLYSVQYREEQILRFLP